MMTMEHLPKAFDACLAIIILGMKVKDDKASYMMRAHQIMLKKDMSAETATGGMQHEAHQLMFNVSSDEETL